MATRFSEVAPLALNKALGIAGQIALALEKKQPVPRETVIRWAEGLRKAAEKLEEFK